MVRYSTSRRRIALLIVLLGMAAFLSAQGFAQTAGGAGGAGGAAGASGATTTVEKQNLVRLILSHPDPVFFTIAALSIVGLTLIIQGFIKNRASVMMPETSTNT